ncbi:hypothetical protein LTR97_000617 [Elasticomyces elasticus]|uniref:SGNH hydrolase-type esterase domain-containing protein n=1 Tax=Elasticomyces elasticus TaxID=574655 RepID=A0AAN7ZQZ1_9PEZI|nr:hypothetical protein LTR97_000617 [Elasticomyces elasticus]
MAPTPPSETSIPHRPRDMANQQDQPKPQHTYTLSDGDRFVLFGDSILQQSFSQNVTFSFGAALADAYARKLDVSNRGFSGYNTLQALRALSLCLPDANKANMQFLLIMFGANDARHPNTPGGPDQHVPLEQFKSNVRHMVSHPSVKAHKDVRIILVTTPPVDEQKCLNSDQEKIPHLGQTLRRTASTTATYAQAIRDLGPELQIPVLDIHRTMLALAGHDLVSEPLPGSIDAPTNPTLQSFLSDGLHFSGEGYKLLYTELMQLIQREWPEAMPVNLPLRLPAWDFHPAWKGNARVGNGQGSGSGSGEEGMGIPEYDMDDGERDDGERLVTGRFEGFVSGVKQVG